MKTIRGKIFLLLIIFFGTPLNFPQQLQFLSEKISIEVKGDYCVVTGWYWFVNHTNNKITRNLTYPFMVSELLPYPYKYEVEDNTGYLPVIKSSKGIMFNIAVEANDTALYIVRYYQNTPARQMEYILTTTSFWGIPLNNAEYNVKMPVYYNLVSMIPEYDKVIQANGTTTFSVIKSNFLPGENFVIRWKGNSYENENK